MDAMKKWLFLKSACIIFLFTTCDGAVKIKIQTVENSSVEGIFKTDTIHNGTAVGNVYIELHFVVRNKTESIDYYIETDSTGNYYGGFPVPPLKMNPEFKGYMTWSKKDYNTDTLYFDHSSSEKRFAVINLVKNKPSL